MNTKIDEVVTASNLRSAAGSRSYSRGEDYFQRGAVHHLYCDGEQLTADVHGTHVYRARIINDDGRLDGECSCPVGRDGSFCKHLVALGLTYLNRQKNAPAEKNKSVFSWKDFLKKCDKDELIKIILEMSPNNSDVIERYRMANLPTSGNAKLRELESKVDELFSLAENMEEYYDDYWDSYDEDDSVDEFTEQSELLLKVLERLASQKELELLWGTTTYAIGKFLDSSNAEMDSVQEFVEGLAKHFLEAVIAQVKPADETYRLFLGWEEKGRNFGYGVISGILSGLSAETREKWAVKALEKWRGYPPCKLGDYRTHDEERDYIERHLLAWADEHKDDKLKLDILEKKMHTSSDVVELAKEYRHQRMPAKIIPLLKRAHKELGRDRAITDLLTEELQKSGGDEQALKLAWDEFTKEPMFDEALNRLQTVSTKMKCWKEYYLKALDFLAEQDKKDDKQKYSFYYRDNIRERRVQVLFAHGDQEAAWELAQGSKLSETCWLKLAEWRSKEMPQDAASVVKNLLKDALSPTGEEAYRHVVQLLKTYHKYLKMANQEVEFTAYCANVRVEYKRRRLLMEQMDAAKL